NFNDYYDPQLKRDRVRWVEQQVGHFPLQRLDLADSEGLERLFAEVRPQVVINLAAQAGVRYSLENPKAYLDSNLSGFLNLLEMCRRYPVEHLIYASSSSVYGANQQTPYKVSDNVDHPLSLYAASKKANELMAHSYSHLFGVPATGLRFFTVYGPWGRPDMALFKFTAGILQGTPIPVFNGGDMVRDFTYVDDIVEGVVRVIDRPAAPDAAWSGDSPDPATSRAPYRIFNIGNNRLVNLMRYIEVLEECLGRKAVMEMLPMQPGDVQATFADVTELSNATGFRPCTPVEEGVAKFVAWYRDYYGVDHDRTPV
ncbi:MAG TPA: NAD-dependent epimerase/dehydratase family protein, partial [Candidatus Glassbacteria bacterium]|nr:NAD-dependent epimerase/dehydratase family protein [Candidatus Glassbacteria bacterium]